MNAMSKTMVLLLVLLVSTSVSAVETPDTGGNKKAVPCVEKGQGLRVLKGDTLSEIAYRMLPMQFQSRTELEDHLFHCNPDAFGDSKHELIVGQPLRFPISEELLLLAKPVSQTPPPTVEPSEQTESIEPTPLLEPSSTVLNVILGITIFLVLLLVALSVYLYRWSKTFRATPVASSTLDPLPSGISHQNAPTQMFADIRDLVAESLKQIRQDSTSNAEKLGTLQNIFTTLHRALDEKDEEIRRFRKGYDAQVFKKFLFRFIRADLAVADFLKDDKTNSESPDIVKRLDIIKQRLEDALDECGVETFSPQTGEDYRRVAGVADNPETTTSSNANEHCKIIEVIKQGYRIKTPDGYEIVYPAKVRIFITQ